MKILAFDFETGGLDPSNSSSLTAYFEILDEDFNTIDELYLEVMPDDGIIKASPEALKVNKIDLEQHKTVAKTYTEANKLLVAFLAKHSSKYDKLIPMGHNVDFDLNFVTSHLIKKSDWDNAVSYRKLCTAALSHFFKLSGWFASGQKMSLGDLAKSMDIQFEGAAHNAKADTKVAIEILKRFTLTMRNLK